MKYLLRSQYIDVVSSTSELMLQYSLLFQKTFCNRSVDGRFWLALIENASAWSSLHSYVWMHNSSYTYTFTTLCYYKGFDVSVDIDQWQSDITNATGVFVASSCFTDKIDPASKDYQCNTYQITRKKMMLGERMINVI